jgi:hypothetical protein
MPKSTEQMTIEAPVNGQQIAVRAPTTMDLLSIALQNNAAIDVIERMAALQRDQLEREAKVAFNEALNRVQNKIKRIAPDMENPDKHNKWATYAAIDRVIRPIYSEEGFSLSFTHADCTKADHVRVVCRVSLRAHIELYQIDMPVDTKGPKGGDVMNLTHATGAADSYAKRYLVKDIFNIAVGEEDKDGNLMTNGEVAEHLGELTRCETLAGLDAAFKAAATKALDAKDINAYTALRQAKDKRKKELQC